MARDTALTVLLVTYNHKDSIEAAIDSVLEQETRYPFELWILDDCSTDGTVEICQKYAQRYPKKIKFFAQPKNTKTRHILKARQKVKTEFLTILEGDDQWCDRRKIEQAVSTLIKYPEYVTFAHDTLYRNRITHDEQSLVHDIHSVEIKNPVDLENAPYLHTSSRIHRNVIDFTEQPVIGDIYLYYAYLDKGPLYYHDKVMSIYNISGQGMWTKLTAKQQSRRADRAQFKLNKMLGFRHDSFFSKRVIHSRRLHVCKKVFGMTLGWKLYLGSTRFSH